MGCPAGRAVRGTYLGVLLGGRGSFRVGVLELQQSMDSAGYHRGLSVWRKGEGGTEAHTQATLPAPHSPDTPSPHSPRCSVPLGPLPGHQAGLTSDRQLSGTGVVVSCWRGGSVRREGGPGLRSRRPPEREQADMSSTEVSGPEVINTAKEG